MGVRTWMKEARAERQLSLNALSRAVDSNVMYMSRIEQGKGNPSVAMAKKLGAALGVDWTKFFEEV